MSKAFEARRCVHHLHVRVVDGKNPCSREGSPRAKAKAKAELGLTSQGKVGERLTRQKSRQVHER